MADPTPGRAQERPTDVGQRIAFIGVGHMGRYMAANLIRAGHSVTIHDARAEARTDPILDGAAWAATPRAAAAASEVVITSLPGPEQVDAVVFGPDGVLAGMHPGDLYIDTTTSTPENIRKIAAAAADQHVEVVDAPVAGGIRGARKGTLTMMAGASEAAFARASVVLAPMSERVFHVGDVGAGHVAKLVNNMMTIVNGLVAMEAMVVGAKAGVDPARLLEVVEASTGGSYSLNVFPYVIFKGNFDPAKFALSLAAKDLRISVDFAAQMGVPISIVPRAAAALAEAMEQGLSNRDWSSYITLIEEPAGVEVRTP
jgi:3-hydroxyisobutyrate dehydrogenase-like beta-hydroxyacid dehydrogenase